MPDEEVLTTPRGFGHCHRPRTAGCSPPPPFPNGSFYFISSFPTAPWCGAHFEADSFSLSPRGSRPPGRQEPLRPDKELGVPPRKPVLELEDMPAWDFEVLALGKGINLYYIQEERCMDTWADERAVCFSLSASPPFL